MTTTLMINYTGLLGGAERVLLQFTERLAGRRWLACPPGPLAEAGGRARVEVLALRARPPELGSTAADRAQAVRQLWGHRREVAALINWLRPELVVANGTRPALALTLPRPLRSRGSWRLAFVHHDFVPAGVVGRSVGLAADRADLVVVPSRAVAGDLVRVSGRGTRRPARVIHPGIDLTRFVAEGQPVQPPEVLILGALVGWKRVDLALEAIAVARRDRPDLQLRVAGVPLDPGSSVAQELVRRLRTRADRTDLAGAVEFLGAVAEPAAELRRATCLLHCAEREPFGLAVAEALAAGRPAVVPAGSGPAEIVDAGCGITYPPGDAQAAAQAIVSLVDDPRRAAALGSHGRERAFTHFEASAAAARFAAAVAEL